MNWLLLDPTPNRDHFTLQQIKCALEKSSHSVRKLRVWKNQSLLTPSSLETILEEFRPQRILWCDVTGLPYVDLWKKHPWNLTPKFDLWFDEPVTPVERFGLAEIMRRSADLPCFHHGIWDGFWRKEAFRRWNIQAHPIHLAVNEFDFESPSEPVSSGEVVFIGMLHSPKMIHEHFSRLPRGLKAVAHQILQRLHEAIDRFSPIPHGEQLLQDALQAVSIKEKILAETESTRSATDLWTLRWMTWASAKNAIRVRMLRKVLSITPVHVFCDQKELAHAQPGEWEEMLSPPNGFLRLQNTSGLSAHEFPKLYQHGTLHLQATDPQSVEGGIPYRVFQTAVAHRVLLSDLKPELQKAFELGKEFLGYNTSTELEVQLKEILNHRSQLTSIAQQARTRVLKEHTWTHRLHTMENWLKDSEKSKRHM